MDLVKFVEDNLYKILFGPFLNTLSHKGPCQTSMLEVFFAETVNGKKLFSQKNNSIMDVWQGPKYASEIVCDTDKFMDDRI